jgi:hypothetical protein
MRLQRQRETSRWKWGRSELEQRLKDEVMRGGWWGSWKEVV